MGPLLSVARSWVFVFTAALTAQMPSVPPTHGSALPLTHVSRVSKPPTLEQFLTNLPREAGVRFTLSKTKRSLAAAFAVSTPSRIARAQATAPLLCFS
jgi:hypothetical protein